MSVIVAGEVADQIERAQEVAEAKVWLRRAVDSGSPYAALVLIALTETADSEDLLKRSISLGNTSAIVGLVRVLEGQGRVDDAEALLRQTVEGWSRSDYWHVFIEFIERHGRSEEANILRRFGLEPGGQTARPW